ncbi:hypothetical protein BU197_10850 [Streptomyces sp. CBMA291]|nr:hypothetical protein [Streptomyces sp. CBMA291]MBD0715975.1 hypothetical protein [Streptomyces sp. CBMA370]
MGLLNLSGLGIGYVLLRNWIGAALCWIATAVLLVAALPADVDGVPGGFLIGYGVFLLAVALDGARRGLHAVLSVGESFRRLVFPLALVLLVVPVGSTLAYGAARDEAREEVLLARLASADVRVKSADGLSFSMAEPVYRMALDEYQDLGLRHAGSRAGKLVPARLDAFYTRVSAPYGKESYCEAVDPLTYLRGLPNTFDKDLLGTRPARMDDPLAKSLYECGTSAFGEGGQSPTADESLNTLYMTFPKSPYALKVEPAVKETVKKWTDSINSGSVTCDTANQLRVLRASLIRMNDPAVAPHVGTAAAGVQKGTFACGTSQFKDKKFGDAITTMEGFAKDYPSSPQAGHARAIAIAAEIAEKEPEAGKKLPPAEEPGGSRMVMVVSNDGPGSVDLLYTGPVSGKVTLDPCKTCTKYRTGFLVPRGGKNEVKACTGPSSKYPKATLLLPAGTYHFLQKRAASAGSTGDTKASKTKIEPGYSYTNCLYVTSVF